MLPHGVLGGRRTFDEHHFLYPERPYACEPTLDVSTSFKLGGRILNGLEKIDGILDKKSGELEYAKDVTFSRVRDLLKEGADPNVTNCVGRSPLMFAAALGDDDICRLLLDNGARVSHKDSQGRSPLFYTALYRSVKICSLLLDKGAEVNSEDDYEETALVAAAESGDGEICKLLISRGADVSDEILEKFVTRGDVDICELLLSSRGAAALRWEDDEWSPDTPFEIAASQGHEAICRLILDNSGDINIDSLLLSATDSNRLNICNLALERGADVKATDGENGWTCLHIAAKKGSSDICCLLLEHGAVVDGEALALAKINEHTEVVLKLQDVMDRKAAKAQARAAAIEEERKREKQELELTVERLQKEKATAEASLEEKCRNRDRENRELIAKVERLEHDKATAAAKYEEESRGRNSEKRKFEMTLEAADVDCRENKKAKHESELEIERLRREKTIVEEKLAKFEFENEELRMIAKQLKEEEAAAQHTQVVKSHVVAKQEPQE